MSKHFDKSKRYVFLKEIYLTQPGRAIEYKNSSSCREWVDEADGQEVQIADELEGRVQGGVYGYHVMVGWCEELPESVDFMTAALSGKKIKYETFDEFYTLKELISMWALVYTETIQREMQGKWYIEC